MEVKLGTLGVIGFVVGVGGLLRLKEMIGALCSFLKVVGEVEEWVRIWWEIRYYLGVSWVSRISSRFVLTAGFKLVYYLIGQPALQFDSIDYEHTIIVDSAMLIW